MKCNFCKITTVNCEYENKFIINSNYNEKQKQRKKNLCRGSMWKILHV